MSIPRTKRPVDPDRLLRPQTRIDLIFSMDLLTGQADVRGSMILDLTPQFAIIAQTDPPILKSMIDREIEASIVHHDLITYESSRWGWSSRILGLDNAYKLNPKDPAATPGAVAFIVLPAKGQIKKTNIRLAYRLDVGSKDSIDLELNPCPARITLLNFSAGGLMVSTPAPSPFELGQEFRFSMTFPENSQLMRTTIKGRLLLVRMEHEPGSLTSKLGLKFQDLDVSTARILEKFINAYMLEEQRLRNRDL